MYLTQVLLYFELLHLLAILDLIYKDLGRFEAGNKVFVNNQSRIPRNIASDFLFSLLVNKAAETTDVNVVTI